MCIRPQTAFSASLTLALLVAPVRGSEVSTEPPPSAAGWRVSALLQFSGGVRAGIVDETNKAVFFIGVGEKKYGAELLSADFETEELVFRKDGVTWRVRLEADPTAKDRFASAGNPSPYTGPYHGPGIEAFLRDHPDAVVKGALPTLSAPPPSAVPAVGFGEGIEKFLRENPELAAQARQPAAGVTAQIDELLRQHPEILEAEVGGTNLDRPRLEQLLRENPQVIEYLLQQSGKPTSPSEAAAPPAASP